VMAALASRPLRDQALFQLQLHTGFRIAEITSLRVGQVFDGRDIRPAVTIARKRLKGGRGQHAKSVTSRSVPLNDTVVGILRQYLFARFGSGSCVADDENAPLFPSRRRGFVLTRWRANVIIHQVMAAAGVQSPERFGTHSLRKTFARRIYAGTGNDINLTRAALGHSQISTTQKYLEVDQEHLTAAILALGRSAGTTPAAGQQAKPA